MKYSKKFIILSLVAILSFPVFGVGTAFAANTGDTGFRFSMGGNGSDATNARAKQNSSPVYIKVESKSMPSHHVYVDAAWCGNNKTVKGVATVKGYGSYNIQTWVYEHGYRSAILTTWNHTSGYASIGGVWSPDSAGRYPVING